MWSSYDIMTSHDTSCDLGGIKHFLGVVTEHSPRPALPHVNEREVQVVR